MSTATHLCTYTAVMPELFEDSEGKDKDMPFSTQLSEHTKFLAFDTWLHNQLKHREDRLALHPEFSKEKKEGYINEKKVYPLKEGLDVVIVEVIQGGFNEANRKL